MATKNPRAIALKEFEALLKSLKDKHYTDQTFPPTRDSICKPQNLSRVPELNIDEKVKFIRAPYLPEIAGLQGEVELFKDGIEPADILQGSLGNSYFLCALAALAENPDRIEKLFLNKVRNKSGVYGVFVCKDGIS